MSQLDRLSQMLSALDSAGRRYVLAVLQMEYDRVQTSRRPVLHLVRSVAVVPATMPQGGARRG
jgi:hypothetical protein